MKQYDTFARYYDADTRYHVEDIHMYQEMARRTGGPVLEFMCGTGRLLLPLANDGYEVTGVDSSPAMLDIAHQRVAEQELQDKVTLIEADARKVELPEQHFPLIFIGINSFMHMQQVKDQLELLNKARQALAPGGVFMIDLYNPNPASLSLDDSRMRLERDYIMDGRHVCKFVMIESDMATQTAMMFFFYDSVDEEGNMKRLGVHFSMRWVYRYELEHLLARAGFRIQAIYGSYDLDDYTSDSDRLIAVASAR
jgi:ubiquinone/menaquinone biosynthesis C-methylase UbiE